MDENNPRPSFPGLVLLKLVFPIQIHISPFTSPLSHFFLQLHPLFSDVGESSKARTTSFVIRRGISLLLYCRFSGQSHSLGNPFSHYTTSAKQARAI